MQMLNDLYGQMMGDLICSCNQASLVNCSICDFGKTCKPVKMFRGPWLCKYKTKAFPKDAVGLDLMAADILKGLSTKQLATIGYEDPTK